MFLKRISFKLILVLMLIPGAVTLILGIMPSLEQPLRPYSNWMVNRTLKGQPKTDPPVPISFQNITSGKLQKDWANYFDLHFAFKELFVRLTNEIYFRVFNESTNPNIILGPRQWVFETTYLGEHFFTRVPESAIDSYVRDLATLQEVCQSQGMAFIVVITPDKVSTYPEEIPPAWRERQDQRPRGVELLVPLLQQRKISYVDGRKITLDEKENSSLDLPLFPKGGTHWSTKAATPTVNAVLRELAHQGKAVSPITAQHSTAKNPYTNADNADILKLLNLAIPWRYPGIQTAVQPVPFSQSPALNLSMVGGSFSAEICRQLAASGQFAEIHYYFYYILKRTAYNISAGTEIRTDPTPSEDALKDAFSADCLILEINEQAASHPSHILAFLKDVLAKKTEATNHSSLRFELSTWESPQLGETYSLTESVSPFIKKSATTGFSGADSSWNWVKEKSAQIRLDLPSASTDLAVEMEWENPEESIPKSSVMTISANDVKMGQWTLPNNPGKLTPRFLIPKNVPRNGKVILSFSVESPIAPANDGASGGLRLNHLKIQPSNSNPAR